MDRDELKRLWRKTLSSPDATRFDMLARSVIELYASDAGFQTHLANRSKRVRERTGVSLDPDSFEIESARAFVADEIGFTSWDELITAAEDPDNENPILFRYTVAAMERGDFTALEDTIGPEKFHSQIVEWQEAGLFKNEQQTLDEIFAASCMLGQASTAGYLLDQGVDPYAGMKTWLAGPHWAASSGHENIIKLLLAKHIPLEVENRYGGTVLGQALWSAVNEHKDTHAEIVEMLIAAGAYVEPGTIEWWEKQDVRSAHTKHRIADSLKKAK